MSDVSTSGRQASVEQFVKLASDYCAFLEDHCAYSTSQFIRHCAESLAVLHDAILTMPQPDEETRKPGGSINVGSITWIARNIGDKLGEQNTYRRAAEQAADTTARYFDSDLTDIYHYLKEGLLLYQANPATGISFWKSNFTANYQFNFHHACEALKQLV